MSGKVEVNAKLGRKPNLTEGNYSAMREWIGEGARTSDCRTPVQFCARMQSIAQTNGTPYVDGIPSARSVLRAKKSMASFGETSNGISTKQARIDTYSVDAIKPYLDVLGESFEKYPILQQEPGRIANFDESPMGTRAEVNKIVVYYLKDERAKGAPLRSASVGEGDGHITAVSVILGDGDRLPNAYIYASQGQNVQPAVMSSPYLPGLDAEHMYKV